MSENNKNNARQGLATSQNVRECAMGSEFTGIRMMVLNPCMKNRFRSC